MTDSEVLFNLVCDLKDWRAPIDAVVDLPSEEPAAFLNNLREAVIHYTATVPDFQGLPEGKVRVTATGYRNGPAGP